VKAGRGSIESAVLRLAVENGEVYGLGILRELRLPHGKYSSVKGALTKFVENFWIYEDRVEKGFRSRRVFYRPTLLGVAKYLRRRQKGVRRVKRREEFKEWMKGCMEILKMNTHLCPPLLKNLEALEELRLIPIFFNPFLELNAEASYNCLILWRDMLSLAGASPSVAELFKRYQAHINYDIFLASAMMFCFFTRYGSQVREIFEKGMKELISSDDELKGFHLSYLQWFIDLEGELMKLKNLKKRISQGDCSAIPLSIIEAQFFGEVTSIILRKEYRRCII